MTTVELNVNWTIFTKWLDGKIMKITLMVMITLMAFAMITLMAMMMMVKMGGLEGTNRLRGRVGRPITPLHTSNPKPTLWSNLDGCA